MIRKIAEDHTDPTLRLLCELFVQRKFPKCILNSAKFCVPLSKKYDVHENVGEVPIRSAKTLVDITEELQRFLADQFARNSLPPEASKYLVSY